MIEALFACIVLIDTVTVSQITPMKGLSRDYAMERINLAASNPKDCFAQGRRILFARYPDLGERLETNPRFQLVQSPYTHWFNVYGGPWIFIDATVTFMGHSGPLK